MGPEKVSTWTHRLFGLGKKLRPTPEAPTYPWCSRSSLCIGDTDTFVSGTVSLAPVHAREEQSESQCVGLFFGLPLSISLGRRSPCVCSLSLLVSIQTMTLTHKHTSSIDLVGLSRKGLHPEH